jgi:hypothetical protein
MEGCVSNGAKKPAKKMAETSRVQLKDLTVDQLKVAVYDQSKIIQQAQAIIRALENEIENRKGAQNGTFGDQCTSGSGSSD